MSLLYPTGRRSGVFSRRLVNVSVFLSVCLIGIVETSSASKPKGSILLVGDSIRVLPNSTNLQIPFRIRNDQDSLVGFEMVIVLSNPEVAVIDTINPLDLGGSVLTDWVVAGQNLFGGLAYRIVGLYNQSLHQPLPPHSELREIFKLNFLWQATLPDTICRSSVQGVLSVPQTHFSDPTGTLIAFTSVDGGIFTDCPPCGDADGNGGVTVSDVVYIVNYIFLGGPPPVYDPAADADCSGIVNVSDVVYIVNYIFGGGPALCSNCIL